MIIKYEIACREAGLSEEQTAEIRKFFDAEKKKLNRRRETRKENGIYYLSIEGMQHLIQIRIQFITILQNMGLCHHGFCLKVFTSAQS